MAIPYAQFSVVSLAELAGATTNVAYIFRDRIDDPRLPGGAIDYTELAGDVIYEDIVLPDENFAGMFDHASLARALDAAELRKVVKPLRERKRLPQAGFALIVALPAPHEASLHEAIEISQRIARLVRGSLPVTIHLAIHKALTNRHAHYLFSTRLLNANGEFAGKARDFAARVRHCSNGAPEIVEGLHWPNLAHEVQQAFFAEIGVDLVVDPIAPIPMRHLKERKELPAARLDHQSANIEIIKGPPLQLIDGLLRGRSTLPVTALKQLCAKFFDDCGRVHIDRILLDEQIVSYTDLHNPSAAGCMTTRPVHDLLMRAAEIIDQPRQTTVVAATGPDEDSVVAQIVRLSEGASTNALILGLSHSDFERTAEAIASETSTLRIEGLDPLGVETELGLRERPLVIVPRAELIEDQQLALLIVAAKEAGSRLVLGHVQGAQTGTVRRQLAAYAADVLATPEVPADHEATALAERLLRAGLVGHAVGAMVNRGRIEFGNRPDCLPTELEFVVCDNPMRLSATRDIVRGSYGHSGPIKAWIQLANIPHEPEFLPGEWLVSTAQLVSNDAVESGEFMQLVGVNQATAVIDVMIRDEFEQIDLRVDHARIQPAAALSLRQAFGLEGPARLTIEVTDPRRVWATLLLAAKHGNHAGIFVDPKIAKNQLEIVVAARRSLFAALPHLRTVFDDVVPELTMAITEDRDGNQTLPGMAPSKPKAPRPVVAPTTLREILADPWAREGYEQLSILLNPSIPEAVANKTKALKMFNDEATRSVICFLAGDGHDGLTARHPHEQADLEASPDLPNDMDEPVHWNFLQIYRLKQNLTHIALPYQTDPLVRWANSLRHHDNRSPSQAPASKREPR